MNIIFDILYAVLGCAILAAAVIIPYRLFCKLLGIHLDE